MSGFINSNEKPLPEQRLKRLMATTKQEPPYAAMKDEPKEHQLQRGNEKQHEQGCHEDNQWKARKPTACDGDLETEMMLT